MASARTMERVYLGLAVVGYAVPGTLMAIESVATGNYLFWADPARTTDPSPRDTVCKPSAVRTRRALLHARSAMSTIVKLKLVTCVAGSFTPCPSNPSPISRSRCAWILRASGIAWSRSSGMSIRDGPLAYHAILDMNWPSSRANWPGPDWRGRRGV